MSWIWQGRQLVKAEKDKKLFFTYDSEGIRTSKTVGSTTTKYLLNGTQILAQKTGSTTLSFFYDQQGNRVGMADGKNNFYYYIYNVQGDVIALADASTGKLVVTYTYDAWGKLVKLEDTTANSVGTQNPFRYRGYYYDTETSLYYLQTRYYDPEVGRFINADAFTSTDISGALSANMFAYCENRPTIGSDPTGEWVHIAIGAAVGVASLYISDVLFNLANGESFASSLTKTSSLSDYCVAAASGALSATGIGAIGSSIVNASISGTAYMVNEYANGRNPDVVQMGKTMLESGVSALIGGKGADGKKLTGIYKTSKLKLKTAVSNKKTNMYKEKIKTVRKSAIKSSISTFLGNLVSVFRNRN